MPQDPDGEEEARRGFARERSHQDANMANEFTKMCIQSLIFLNGGSATAVASFYSVAKIGTRSTSIRDVMLVIGLYAFGVFLAIIAGLVFRGSIYAWSRYWQIAYENGDDAGKYSNRGVNMRNAGVALLVSSAALFFVASILMTVVFSMSS